MSLPPKQVAQLKRTVSSTQLLASEILSQLKKKKSSRPPKPLEEKTEGKTEGTKKKDEKKTQ